MSPIAKALPSATQSDVLEILQREQDRAIALLSSSPLLSGLFVSYANRAAALRSSVLSTENEGRKALESVVSRLREEIDELKLEKLEMAERLAVTMASIEAFRSQVTSLKEVRVAQQRDVDSLQAELFEFEGRYNQLAESSNAEREALRTMVSDLEVRWHRAYIWVQRAD